MLTVYCCELQSETKLKKKKLSLKVIDLGWAFKEVSQIFVKVNVYLVPGEKKGGKL